MCLNFGIPKNNYFTFGTNGKIIILGVPILQHIMVNKFAYGTLTMKLRSRSSKPVWSSSERTLFWGKRSQVQIAIQPIGNWIDGRHAILRPFEQYFSHIRMMVG